MQRLAAAFMTAHQQLGKVSDSKVCNMQGAAHHKLSQLRGSDPCALISALLKVIPAITAALHDMVGWCQSQGVTYPLGAQVPGQLQVLPCHHSSSSSRPLHPHQPPPPRCLQEQDPSFYTNRLQDIDVSCCSDRTAKCCLSSLRCPSWDLVILNTPNAQQHGWALFDAQLPAYVS